MTRFTLVVRPDGRAVLATRERLSVQEAAELGRQLRGWEDGDRLTIAVIAECDVVQVSELDLELEAAWRDEPLEGATA